MKIKKYISVFLITTLLFTAVPTALAIDQEPPGSSPDNPIKVKPDEPVNLVKNPEKDNTSTGTGSKPDPVPPNKKDKSPFDNSGQSEKIGTVWGETHTTVTTNEKTIAWLWTSFGPGSMKMISPATQGFFGFQAGYDVWVSFSVKGSYRVIASPIKQKTTITTVTRDEYDVYRQKVPGSDEYTQSISPTPHTVVIKNEKVTTDPYVDTKNPRNYYIYVDSDDPIHIPDNHLSTTINATFSRQYVYTQHCIDTKTNKPFELEVTFDFTANTKIVSLGKPSQLITRYLNQGTMTVTPVAFQILEGGVGSTHVKYWAKFIYPKASVPGGSTMTFPVSVQTLSGAYSINPTIDVPVNTYNGRFTDLPDSERGEFYPIQNVVKQSGGFAIKAGYDKWGTHEWRPLVGK